MPDSELQSGYEIPGAEVLTLAEAASFLRVPEEAVLELVTREALPAQRVGGEWRVLKRALHEHLSSERGSKRAVLKHFGIFKGDADLDEYLAGIRD